MPDCMREMDARGLREAVLDAARSKPFLGICIGLQMLFEHSEEGDVAGLGVLPGRVRRFPAEPMLDAGGAHLKVPHMGWNRVRQTAAHPLWRDIADEARFYFVHSYYVETGAELVVRHQRISVSVYLRDRARQRLRGAISPGKEPAGGPATAREFRAMAAGTAAN